MNVLKVKSVQWMMVWLGVRLWAGLLFSFSLTVWFTYLLSFLHSFRLCVDRLSVWPQHHFKHADIPAEHPTGHLVHPHPGLPHLCLRPSCQLQLHQHWHQHWYSQCHHWWVVLWFCPDNPVLQFRHWAIWQQITKCFPFHLHCPCLLSQSVKSLCCSCVCLHN